MVAGRFHCLDGCGEKDAVFDGALDAELVAHLDVGHGDGVAAFAEGRVFVNLEGVGGMIDHAVEGDLGVIDGGDTSGEPSLAVLGLEFSGLFGAFGVELEDHEGADGLFGGVRFPASHDCVANLDLSRFDLLRHGAVAFSTAALPLLCGWGSGSG